MSELEDDYMSDAFLTGLSDVRPSLINDRAKKRQVQVSQKKEQNIKRQREDRATRTGADRNERLQESLQRPIEEGNKGFQLLAKMGYKPGDSLGKTSTTGAAAGIKEPIGINIKTDRGGLGREAALRDLAEKRLQLRVKYMQRLREQTETVSAEEYRQRKAAIAEERFLQIALRKCQAACENLDITKTHLETPNMPWFWPERSNAEQSEDAAESDDISSEDEDEIEYTTAEKLEMLTSYLRTAYKYCNWCGVHYNNAEDLDTNCPGLTRDDH